MRIILLGNQNWGVLALRALLRTSHQIICVYTHPRNMDKNEKVWYESVKEECERHSIKVIERKLLGKEDEEEIRLLSPDVMFSVGWRRLLTKSLFEIPRYGTINIHEGLLPNYRGFAPTNWSIINGETEAGVTVHFVDEQ